MTIMGAIDLFNMMAVFHYTQKFSESLRCNITTGYLFTLMTGLQKPSEVVWMYEVLAFIKLHFPYCDMGESTNSS